MLAQLASSQIHGLYPKGCLSGRVQGELSACPARKDSSARMVCVAIVHQARRVSRLELLVLDANQWVQLL